MKDSWIRLRAHQLADQMIGWRRHLHQYPELSFQEYETSRFIVEELRKIPGMEIETGVGAETSVVATISSGSGPVVAVRADIDALPIIEETNHSYSSLSNGVMHACGHDAHAAILLAVAALLGEAREKGELNGTVKLIFQPAEEAADHLGKTGALYLVEAGVLDEAECVIALHMSPEHRVGDILIHDGYSMANVDVFEATIHGTGGHGAYPHLGSDPIWMLGPVLQAIHGIIARNISPLDPAVISIGEVRAGTASNVIPPDVYLQGTMRSYSPDVREMLIEKLRKAFSIVESFEGTYSLSVNKGEPALYNNPSVNQVIRQTVHHLYPEMKQQDLPFGLGGEDFSHMALKIPGAMFFLGCALQDGKHRELHTPVFDIDESCMPIGASILTQTAMNILNRNSEIQNDTFGLKIV
ncbi:amidohydrolase [Bacillus gobiensis]|uniref:M20 metallopeptidase family protein n=1 Tax=Bacillus gobiensis TaxID=1441095 RepID=UPI003D2238EF